MESRHNLGAGANFSSLGPSKVNLASSGGLLDFIAVVITMIFIAHEPIRIFWTSPPITTPNLTTNERRQSFSTLLCIQAGSCLMPLAWLAKLRRGCRTLCKLLRSQEQFLASRRDTGIFSLYPCRRSVILRFNESLCLLSCPCCVVVLMVVAVVAFMNVTAMANIRAVPFTCDASSCSCPCCCCFVVALLLLCCCFVVALLLLCCCFVVAVLAVVVVVPHITVWGSCFSLGSRRGSAPSPPPPPPPPPPPHSHSPLITHSLSPSFTSHLTHISSSLIT